MASKPCSTAMSSVRCLARMAIRVWTMCRLGSAQTWSDCNPLNEGEAWSKWTKSAASDTQGSPNRHTVRQTALQDLHSEKSIAVDFTKGENTEFFEPMDPMHRAQISYDSRGAVMTITNATDAPGLQLKSYIYYGRVDVTVQAAPGVGIVTSVVLVGDALAEIDLVRLVLRHMLLSTPINLHELPTTAYRNGSAATRWSFRQTTSHLTSLQIPCPIRTERQMHAPRPPSTRRYGIPADIQYRLDAAEHCLLD